MKLTKKQLTNELVKDIKELTGEANPDLDSMFFTIEDVLDYVEQYKIIGG